MGNLNFKINRNGDTMDTFKKNALRVGLALSGLEQALANAYPHGRNYQTVQGQTPAHAADVDRFQEAFKALKVVEQLHVDLVATIADQMK